MSNRPPFVFTVRSACRYTLTLQRRPEGSPVKTIQNKKRTDVSAYQMIEIE